MTAIKTDVLIIGAGPVGIFQIFELGLLNIHAQIVDALPQPGGQCAELYPEKPIYDIPACPEITAQKLVDNLLQQAAPFKADFHLKQLVTELNTLENGRFEVSTNTGTRFDTATIILAAGLGPFQPRRIRLAEVDKFEGSQINYKVNDKSAYAGKRLAILGGGDSALDWVLELADICEHIHLIHRRKEYRGQPASVDKMQTLLSQGKISEHHGNISGLVTEGDNLTGLKLHSPDNAEKILEVDSVLVFWGLIPNLGPIAEWGLELEKRQVPVDTEKFQTIRPGIFAVGDINTYPGKKKLILSGFHEAALAAFAIQAYLDPEKKARLQYTTTSPLMHERLGLKKGKTQDSKDK